MNKKGFAIIEVLVAFMIITMSLATLIYSQKNFQGDIQRLYSYENIYNTVLSLKNKIDIELQFDNKQYYTGKLNGYNYRIELKKKIEKRNIIFDDLKGMMEGNHIYTLYNVQIKLIDINQNYSFYKLKTSTDKPPLEDF